MAVHEGTVSFLSGLVAGTAQAGLFNPYDRALYLSVKNRTRFLSRENFRNPYQGFFQSIGGRALSGGLYFPLENYFKSLVPADGAAIDNFVAGSCAGAANALILNPLSAVKYKTWGRDRNRGVWKEAKSMFRKGGLRPFGNGLVPTVLRDLVFGGCYTFLRMQAQRAGLPPEHQWVANFAAAAVATVASGPFNLVRIEQYGTKSHHNAPSIAQTLSKLSRRVSKKRSVGRKLLYLQKRLRIGWGTVRVAVGMAFGNHVYDYCMCTFDGER